MATLALTIAYDGTDFAGSQMQPGARTVQEELERALAGLFNRATRTVFAGRTDRGVHAAAQVVSCDDGRPDLDSRTLRRAIDAVLPDDLAVLDVTRRPDGFHARYDARWREYRYRVWFGPRSPLARRQAWYRAERLDVEEMDRAAGRLVGEHDFAALAGGGEGVPWSDRQMRPRGTVRRVMICRCRAIEPWWGPAAGPLIEVRIAADGFLPRMVRNAVGALVEIGRGARPAAWIDELLATRDRRAGGTTAPAHGLTFWRVGYDDDEPMNEAFGGDPPGA